ncbi:MAG TPA: ATP-binding protein [Caulobacteraceae bacterium]|nr:ATP-binding protein [Caulobacteraceae bacterium]
MSEAYLVLGCPGSGKTTRARALAAEMTAVGAALIVVDTGRVEAFDDMYHARSLDELIDVVWEDGDDIAFTPKDGEEFDRLCGAIYGGRNVVLLVDELYNVVPSVRSIPENFQRCLRERRRVLAGAVVTSQLYRDCGRAMKGLVTHILVGRMTAPEDQADLKADYGLEPERVGQLPPARENPDGAFIPLKVGF